MFTLYEKETGKPKNFTHVVDAKESLESGFYVQEKPVKDKPKIEKKPAPKTEPKKVVKEPEVKKEEAKKDESEEKEEDKKELSLPKYKSDSKSTPKIIRK